MTTSPDGNTRAGLGARATASLYRVDARLMALPKPVQYALIAFTLVVMMWQSLPWVPRPLVDYSRIAFLRDAPQPATYGPDTLADEYEARVVLHDPWDMYSKRETGQTPLEASAWSKAASAPYPPGTLLIEAALFRLGGRTLEGFYLAIIALAVLFLALSLHYFLRTRWYLFPVLYLNFAYLAWRFVGVQDGTYLIELVVVVLALLAAERRRAVAQALMALGIVLKLSPLFYAIEMLHMRRATVIVFIAILLIGLALPVLLLPNYLYIYTFESSLKGTRSMHAAALAAAVPFAIVLWYVETRLSWDLEDRIGWSVVPFALYFALRTNSARHLILMLLVPDKRTARNLAVAAGLGLQAALPSVIRLGSVLSIVAGLLVVILAGHLCRIGYGTIRNDVLHPIQTARLLAGAPVPRGT
jgi:hypothetical protein